MSETKATEMTVEEMVRERKGDYLSAVADLESNNARLREALKSIIGARGPLAQGKAEGDAMVVLAETEGVA